MELIAAANISLPRRRAGTFLELGSGDGRNLILAVEHGVEYNAAQSRAHLCPMLQVLANGYLGQVHSQYDESKKKATRDRLTTLSIAARVMIRGKWSALVVTSGGDAVQQRLDRPADVLVEFGVAAVLSSLGENLFQFGYHGQQDLGIDAKLEIGE